jgi:hypothetical protein
MISLLPYPLPESIFSLFHSLISMAPLALLLGFKKGRFFRKNLPFLELDKGKDWRVILRMLVCISTGLPAKNFSLAIFIECKLIYLFDDLIVYPEIAAPTTLFFLFAVAFKTSTK